MSGTITDLSSAAPPRDLAVDVCVVGSGCGGATAAWTLAEAGLDVVVLEEGGDYTGTRLTQRDSEMYDQLYMDRGGRSTDDLSITILQGRVLGGGGVINASDVVPIPHGVLDHWEHHFGLTHLSEPNLRPYLARALEDLSVNPITDHQVNKANALLRRGTEALGMRGEVMDHNRLGCAGLGKCLIGCPLNAKRNPRFVALPGALAAGARVFTRGRVVRIADGKKEIKRVRVHPLDARGYHEDPDRAFEVRARAVVVAANAVATPQLLLRSGLGNRHVGRHLMLQPQLPVVARFPDRVDGYKGIPQSYAVTEHEVEDAPGLGLWGYRVEGIMGTPGIVSSLIPFTGPDVKAVMAAYDHLAASLLLVPDRPSGAVRLASDGRPLVRYEHREEHRDRLRAAVRTAVRIYLAAGAEEVVVPVASPLRFHREADLAQVDSLTFAPATAPLVSAHQMGSVVMSGSKREGACDPDGQVYGTRGVYVMDSSVFPSSASSHIMAPILTVSRYLADRLAATLGA